MSVLKNIKEELLTNDGPIFKPLHNNEGFKAIAIGLKKGSVIEEHKANWPSKLTVLEGKVNFVQENSTTEISQYETHDIVVGVLHYVEASEDSLCLLTQSRPSE